MKIVVSRLGDDGDGPTSGPRILGLDAGGDHRELLNGVHRDLLNETAYRVVGVIATIEHEENARDHFRWYRN